MPHKVSCGVGFGPVTFLRQDKGPVATQNSATRAEIDISVNRNRELENRVEGARCWVLGLGSNSRLLGKGSKDTLALKPQIIVLERAGTLKKGLILCLPEPLGPCGGRGRGGGGHRAFQLPTKQSRSLLFSECSWNFGKEIPLQK